MSDLLNVSATTLAKRIRNKEVSSEEVVNAHLRRIEAVNPKLNAVVQLDAERAQTEARQADAAVARGEIKGPLHGVPITVKDSIDVAGMIQAVGTKGRWSFVPKQDATAVARMRDAGAIVIGKTNVPEVLMAYETDNLVYGRTNNPYDLSRTPGGSGGGEAAIIAAGGSPLGLGGDLAGSLRVPAHFCGIAGLKPTTGRVPRTGHFPPLGGATDLLWSQGPTARFVEDLTLTLPIIAGVDWRDPAIVPMPLSDPTQVDLAKLRGAFYTDNGIMPPSSETAEALIKAVRVLTDGGMSMEENRPPGIEQTYDIFLGLFGGSGGAQIERLLQMAGTTETHPLLQRFLEVLKPHKMDAGAFMRLMFVWNLWRGTMLTFLEKHDFILCPTCACPAMPHGTSGDGDKYPPFSFASYCMTYNLTGWPCVVLRAGTSAEGLPIDVQVVARPWCEDVALAVAQQIETALGGWQPPPL